ncbi:MAG: hypothetical protein M3O02_01545 [Acidobacteriota bacterium]|nr:hypothetical protein [Acidobacteriota bacterium]
MLDVHPPHEKIHSLRDFLLHLLTITIGLLIALGLEAMVEAAHHRRERIEAEQMIRRELRENRDSLMKMQTTTMSEILDLQRALVFAEDLRSGKKDDPAGLKLGFTVGPLQSAAWSAASLNGAIGYMDYAEVQRFASAYKNQDLFERSAELALQHYEVLETYVAPGDDPRNMKPQDIETAIPDVRRAIADLRSMYDAGRGTLAVYGQALKL